MNTHRAISRDVAVIGAGSIGIAVAYYLLKNHGLKNVTLIDPLDPMGLTSAQSGENYRNWWPHPTMTAFTNHSIDLLEDIARKTDNRINILRRGYALVTREASPVSLIEDLYRGYGSEAEGLIRIHDGSSRTYVPPISSAWQEAPNGVDVLRDPNLIRKTFPTFAHDVQTVLHIRRAGSISGQQLGQFMLEAIREAGGNLLRGTVIAVEGSSPFELTVQCDDGQCEDGTRTIWAERVVNAAGPYLGHVAKLFGEDLPVSNIYQQKIAFEDSEGVIPRDMPFTIDLDPLQLPWTEEERDILASSPEFAKLLEVMPGGIHCRPEGTHGRWIKLGWAYNTQASNPDAPAPKNEQFPDLVLRAASRLHPDLQTYLGHLPPGTHHYGGYYTMTDENWPLIGPMKMPGSFVAGALSGFGTMAACATGAVCAAWVAGGNLPSYALAFSPARYENSAIMAELAAMKSKGVL